MTTRDEDCLTTAEALTFLQDVLGLTSPEEKVKKDPEAFLGEVMRAMPHHVPFQTITAISTPDRDRHLLTRADIKRDMSAKYGGVCYPINTFTWMILCALGYNVSLITCDLRLIKNVHITLLVHDLTSDGSIHLVDVGTAYPTFHPIPLHDFADVSPEYHHSYLRYRFVRVEGSGVIARQHWIECDPARRQEFEGWSKDGWYPFIHMHVDQPVDHAHFNEAMRSVYTDSAHELPFLRCPRCVAYPNGRWVCIKGTTLLTEDEEGKVHKSYFRSLEEILDAYARYFPQFPRGMITAALRDGNVKLDFNK